MNDSVIPTGAQRISEEVNQIRPLSKVGKSTHHYMVCCIHISYSWTVIKLLKFFISRQQVVLDIYKIISEIVFISPFKKTALFNGF